MIRVHRYLIAFALAASFVAFPAASFAGVFIGIGFGNGIGVSVDIAPPPLPVYEQPPCDVADTIWTPGYWAYGPYGYYWVPGTWVEAPQVGYLWTPGYWGYGDGAYAWHGGYWGPHVGFYGGVDYGFGYGGNGYDGGGWNGDHFRYNTAYTNVNRTTINNVYVNRTVVNNYYNGGTTNRTSYNGGANGLHFHPTANEVAYRNDRHLPLTPVQRQHIDTAAQNRNFLDSVNHGRPTDAALATPLNRTHRPADFSPATAADRRGNAAEANTASRYNDPERTTTDPFSRFNRTSPSSVRATNAVANEPARFDREKSATTDPFARFDRHSPSYARSNARSSANDAYARFDRSASNRSVYSNGAERSANAYHPQASNRSERSYGAERSANVYHPQASNRSERSYGAPASRYRPEATYHAHAAPAAERPSERSHPVEHSAPHRDESNHGRDH